MDNLNWGMIGAIATILSVIVAIIIAVLQSRKSKNINGNGKKNNQIINGHTISNNKIEQNNK